MKELMLFFHFIGLAMGLGTSIAFMIFGITSSKMEMNEARKFRSNILVLSKMGYTGIALLVISGIFLMTPYWESVASSPLLLAKLILVLFLIAVITANGITLNRIKKGAPESLYKRVQILGRVGLITALIIVAIASYYFG